MRKATFDPAKRLDLYFRINRNGSKAFNFLNVDGSARSLIYETYSLVIRAYSGGTIFITLPLTIVSNVVTATITEELSRVNEGEYFYELIRTDVGKTYLCGKAIFHNGVFDGVTTDTNSITIAESTETINIVISESGGIVDPIVYESGNAIEVGEDNKIGWGNQFTKNTTIPGDSVNLQFGTTDSRLNRFIQHVSGLVQNFIQAAGAWLTVVGTAQVVITEQATSIENDNVVGFKKQGDVVNTFEVTNLEDDVAAPKVTANEPLELVNIDSQEELDRIITNNQLGKYREGALAYYNLPGRQPAIIYTFGGTLYSLNSYVDIGRYSQPSQYAPTSLQSIRTYEIQELLKSFDRLHVQFIVELEETAASEFGIRIWHDPIDTSPEFTDICLIETNSPGRYVIDVELAIGVLNVLEEDLWKQFCTAKIVGPADENAAGYGTSVYPIQDFDTDGITAIQVVGKCALASTLRVIHQDGYIMRQQVEI